MKILKHLLITYCILFSLIIFNSCNLGLTKCKDIDTLEISYYKIIKSECLGPAGPHFYPLSIYQSGKLLGSNAHQKDPCTITFQPKNDSYLIFNICQKDLIEIKPDKKQISLDDVDSVQIFSNKLKQTKSLTKNQVNKFISDWNNSKASDYRDENIDSIFHPAFQYKLTVYVQGRTTEFLGSNFLVNNRTHWVYYIVHERDTNYFHNLWSN